LVAMSPLLIDNPNVLLIFFLKYSFELRLGISYFWIWCTSLKLHVIVYLKLFSFCRKAITTLMIIHNTLVVNITCA
jgi:hypothetical protein